MKLQIERSYVGALVGEYPDLNFLNEQLKFGNKAEIPFNDMSAQQLEFLHDLYLATGPSGLGNAAQIAIL